MTGAIGRVDDVKPGPLDRTERGPEVMAQKKIDKLADAMAEAPEELDDVEDEVELNELEQEIEAPQPKRRRRKKA